MSRVRWIPPFLVGVIVAIGCGGGTPQDASAKPELPAHTEGPIQVAAATAEAQPSTGGSASVTGTVHLDGQAPARVKVNMQADPVCLQQRQEAAGTEEVVVDGSGGLRNVLVYVKEGAKGPFPAPSTPVVLDQSGCWYTPHVFGIQVDQPLEIVNSDPTLHNVNVKPASNTPFNVAQPVKGMKTTKKFAKPEVGVKFKCNVHPWMSAYAGVVEHPFFSVSGADGSFAISALPAGTYVVEAWHEKYGTQTQTVSVGDGETRSVDFTFQAQ